MTRRRVYFIKPIGMDGPVKIGCSASPDGRRSTLQTWSPFPLEIVAKMEGDEGLERRFHAKFRASAKTREWFDWTPELGETIKAVRDGNFEVDSLPVGGRVKDYRKPRDLSFVTPAYRYRCSVNARLRSIRAAVAPATRRLDAILGVSHITADPELFVRHREEIEQLIADIGGNRKPLRTAERKAA